MESAINALVSRFMAYAGRDGSSDTVSRDEFCRLVSSELPNFVKNAGDFAAIDQLMSSLDKNNDGELNFLEFWQLIGDMESAIKTLVTTFVKSARGKENLDSKSFQKMVEKNLSGVMEDANNASAVKEMLRGLDENSDGKVCFDEYLTLIGYLANSVSQSKTGSNPDAS